VNNEQIYLSAPDVGTAEEAAVVRAMRSGWIAPLGPEVDAFEKELADATQRQHAVALSSGTAALHVALLNFGVHAGDVVITSTLTFAATANAITYTHATPVFVDCDATGNIDVDLLLEAVLDQRRRGNRVAALVPVDLLGKVAAYEVIEKIAQDHSIPVLSDAAESMGARRNGRSAGSYGDAAAMSFNGNKIMTTSGGGALLTDDRNFAARARYLATQARQPVPHYEHTEVGYNYRMSNLLAALGRAQLARLESMIERRHQLRLQYRELFKGVPGVSIFGEDDGADGLATRDNYWLTSILVNADEAGWHACELMSYLAHHQIEARPFWKPMHAQPVFAACPAYVNGTSDALFACGISLPSGSGLTPAQTARVTGTIFDFLARTPYLGAERKERYS
jgi:dTDP-4-amino-4,6-dideoxygalactose transaminase